MRNGSPVILLLFVSLLLFCSNNNCYAQKLIKLRYGANSDLQTNMIYDIFMSSSNNLYISTDNGLWTFNGIRFKQFKHASKYSNELSHIEEDAAGRIYVNDFNGNIFRLKDDSLTLLPLKIPTKITIYTIGKDYSYYGNRKQLFAVHNQSGAVQSINLNMDMTHWGIQYFLNNEQVVLISNDRKKTCIKQLKDMQLCVENTGLGADFPLPCFNSDALIFWDKSSNKIVESSDKYLIDLSVFKQDLRPYCSAKIDSSYLIGCYEGLIVGGEKKLFLKGAFVNGILQDHAGNVWIATINQGLYKVSNLKNRHYPLSAASGEVDKFYVDKNNILCSNRVGVLSGWNAKNEQLQPLYTPSVRGAVKNIYLDTVSKVYLVSGNQLVLLDHKQKLLKKRQGVGKCTYNGGDQFVLNQNNKMLFYGSLSRYMVSFNDTSNQCIKFDDYHIYNYQNGALTKFQLLPKKKETSLLKWEDNIVGLWNDSLFLVNTSTYDKKLIQTFEAARGAFLENNRLFVFSPDEILEFDSNGNILQKIGRSNGTEERLLDFSSDADHFCMTTKKAIYILDKQNLHVIAKYTTQNGIQSNDFSMAKLMEGHLLVNGSNGLSKIDLDKPYNPGKPQIRLDKILTDNKISLDSVFMHNNNNLEFQLNVLSYTTTGALKWRLNKQKWRVLEGNNLLLNNLSDGSYQLEFIFENSLGTTSNRIHYNFSIQRPYWKSWWFSLLIIVMLLGIALSVGLQQSERKRKAAKMKAQINQLRLQSLQSQMNPHFIFNIQAAIQGLWLEGKEIAALNMQTNFSKLLRKIFQYSGKVSISIDQLVDFLNNYINLEKIRFDNEIIIDFEISNELLNDDLYIPPLLIQPIIENSFKHGLLHKKDDKRLKIELAKEANYLFCAIEDNGIGRKKKDNLSDVSRKASGLKTTLDRLKLLQLTIIREKHPHNNMKITDLKNNDTDPIGTKVEMWIPFVDFKK